MQKYLNGILTDMTAEEISAKKAEEQIWLEEQSKNEKEATARENLKASAKAKLIAGQPLTEEEADTIVF
tara:strand:+ start:1164 stop:1370 length:207 start_codon:yes stop_codon:yes gene_type:complete